MNTGYSEVNYFNKCFKCGEYKNLFKCLKLCKMDNEGNPILDKKGNIIMGFMCYSCCNKIKKLRDGKCLFCESIDNGICHNCRKNYYVKTNYL